MTIENNLGWDKEDMPLPIDEFLLAEKSCILEECPFEGSSGFNCSECNYLRLKPMKSKSITEEKVEHISKHNSIGSAPSIEKYNAEIQEKEKILENLKNEIKKLAAEKMNLEEGLEVQERLIDENTRIKKENEEILSIVAQKNELEKLKNEIENLVVEKRNLKESLGMRKLIDEIALLKQDKANIIVERKRMIDSKKVLNDEIEKLINRKREYLEKMTEYEDTIIDMEQEQRALLKDIERLKQEYNNLVTKEFKN